MSPLWFLILLFYLPKSTPHVLSKFLISQTPIIDKFKNLKRLFDEQTQGAYIYQEIIKSLKYHRVPTVIDAEFVFERELYCRVCPIVLNIVIQKRRQGFSRKEWEIIFNFACTNIGGGKAKICKAYIEELLGVILYVIDHKPDLKSEKMCDLVYQNYGCSYDEYYNFSVKIPSGNPVKRPKPFQNKTFTILHISDIHYDPLYTPNGNAACDEPLCCQNDQGLPSSPELGCGCWGDYRSSDAPWNLIEETIKQTKKKPFDFVYFTGDIIPHALWHISVENNSELFTKINSLLKQNYDVPIYSVLGNHESFPLDYWGPPAVDPRFRTDWLYQLAAQQFSEMSSQDVSNTVLEGGYYTLSPKPGFRVIALNNNGALIANHWLMYDHTYIYEQLQWFVDVLKEAEEKNEAVHVISHVPAGTVDTIKAWDREYARIIERFAGTITAQFNGHSHYDEFRVFYNSSNHSQPIGAAFNGASITPFEAKANPSFKYLTVDSTTYDLMDYEEYTFNLSLANSKCSEAPEWYKLYSFKEAYGAESLRPEELDIVVHKMAKNHSLLNDYFRFYHRNGDPAIKDGCDDRCRRNFLCQMVTVVYGSGCDCQRFLAIYDKNN